MNKSKRHFEKSRRVRSKEPALGAQNRTYMIGEATKGSLFRSRRTSFFLTSSFCWEIREFHITLPTVEILSPS